MLSLIVILLLFFVSGYAMLWGSEFRRSGVVQPALSVIVGVPITIALAAFLLTANILTLGVLILTVALFVGLCLFVVGPVRAGSPGKILSVENLARPIAGGRRVLRLRAARHYVLVLLDLLILAGLCISTFYIRNNWQGDTNAPDVWAHINWANHIAISRGHDYIYMPGIHILIWIVSKIFGCSIYTAGVNLPVFLCMYLPITAYFAGSWAFNRTTGLMLALTYLMSPMSSLTYNSTLLLPRNIAHSFFVLGMLLTTGTLARTSKKRTPGIIAAGAVIGTMVVTHLAWEEVLGAAAWAITLIVIAAVYRKKLVNAGVMVLTAFIIVAPYMSKMVYQKLQAESYFNISPDKLTPFSAAHLYKSVFPITIWIAIVSLGLFLLLWVGRFKLPLLSLQRKITVSRTRILKPAIMAVICVVMSASAFVLLLCVGREGIEAFVYGTLPLPHPIETDRFFTMLAFGLLSGVGLVGYLPVCMGKKWRLPAIGLVILVFVLILAAPQMAAKNTAKGSSAFASAIPMWAVLGLAVLMADFGAGILAKVKNRRFFVNLSIIIISVTAGLSMPSAKPIRRFISQGPKFVARPTKLGKLIIDTATEDAVIVSSWPYLDSLEYLLGRRIADGLLGPGAFWSQHRPGLPGKYWNSLRFVDNKIANAPEEIVQALHEDFGPNVYLYFRVERHSPYQAHNRFNNDLTPYTSHLSKEIYGVPPIAEPWRRFANMIAYFHAHSRYFKELGREERAVLFKVISGE